MNEKSLNFMSLYVNAYLSNSLMGRYFKSGEKNSITIVKAAFQCMFCIEFPDYLSTNGH